MGDPSRIAALERELAEERATGAREAVARWMIEHSIATGHGDTLDDLLGELAATARRDAFEEAAKAARDEFWAYYCRLMGRDPEATGEDEISGFDLAVYEITPVFAEFLENRLGIRSLATVPGGEGKTDA